MKPGDFRTHFVAAARRFGVRHAAGAFLCVDDIQFAEAQAGFGVDSAQPIFCLVKVFTANLIAQAAQSGRLALAQGLNELFETGPLIEADGAARNVTMFHLLSHTHGWESAPALEVRRDSSGFITPKAILRDLASRPRLYEPGAMYSYDSAGYLLLGAVLEKLHGERFGALLQRHLLAPLGMDAAIVDSACPAEGYGLALSVRALSRFVDCQLAPEKYQRALPHAAETTRMLATRVIGTPGWSPFYQGTTLAWRDLGAGWLSHEGVGMHGSCYAMVRLNPDARIGLVIMSPDPRARLMGAHVFNQISRADIKADFALPLTGAALGAFAPGAFCGAYANGKSRTTIYRNPAGEIEVQLAFPPRPGLDAVCEARGLRPATRDVLFLKAPVGRRHFIQPLRGAAGKSFTHLWDGFEVARRIDREA